MTIAEAKKMIKDLNLMDFASRHYGAEFTPSGNLFHSRCCLPGHKHDNSPSLFYYPDTNTLTCFGCEDIKGGDIFTFVSVMEDIPTEKDGFIEIIKLILQKEGINVPLDSKPVDPKILQLKEFKTNCATAYKKALWSDKNSFAFQYLLDRGLTEQTINNFHLGVTSENEARYGRAGISNRIVIPILDSTGKAVIACSFRQLFGSDSEAKYIHDKNDEVFNKSIVFYGYSHAIETIKKTKHVYIVEGYFDMMSLYQAGIKNVVACMSNRMTQDQINLLANVAKSITIILDQDSAGMKGFRETLPMMIHAGLNVRVVPSLMYMGKDANDLCNKMGWDESSIKGFLANNDKDAIQYMLSGVLDKYDDVVLQAREVTLKTCQDLINCIGDPTKSRNYEMYLNKRLNM